MSKPKNETGENKTVLEPAKPDSGKPATLESLPVDNLDAAADDVSAAIKRNTDAKKDVKPAGGKPAEGTGPGGEPLSNFQTDENGKIKTNKDGTPKRRGGRPRKAKPGDTLADGGRKGIGGDGDASTPSPPAPAASVVIPGQTPEGQPLPPERPGYEAGPEAGRLLSKLGFTLAKKKGGDKWEPDDDERELIGEAAAASLNGRRLPWAVVLVFGVAAYVLARVEFKRKEKQDGKKKPSDDTHLHHGPDAERQDDAGSAASPLIF